MNSELRALVELPKPAFPAHDAGVDGLREWDAAPDLYTAEQMRAYGDAILARQGEGWRGMESAPRDGTWIIVYGAGYEMPIIARWKKPIQSWAGVVLMGGGFQHMRDATHWQPLPAPPQTEGVGNG